MKKQITIDFQLPKPHKRNGVWRNKPFRSSRKGKKREVYPETSRYTTGGNSIAYGKADARQNTSRKKWESYIKRAAFIKNKSGQYTANNPMSRNYWAIRDLWNPRKHGITKPFTLTLKNGNKIYIKP